MHYSGSQTPVMRGGNGETRSDIDLVPGEYITTITGTVKDCVIASLWFVTNRGILPTNTVPTLYPLLTRRIIGSTFGPYGQAGNGPSQQGFTWHAGENVPAPLAARMGLLYFTGNASWV